MKPNFFQKNTSPGAAKKTQDKLSYLMLDIACIAKYDLDFKTRVERVTDHWTKEDKDKYISELATEMQDIIKQASKLNI